MTNSFEDKNLQTKVNPELTRAFVEDAKAKAEKGTYKVDVKVGDKIIPIYVFPEVFPPKSDYSVSSRSVYESFGNLNGLEVADIGSGSGVESIVAVLAGAKHVDATDLNHTAVECTKHNVAINGLEGKIDVFEGDLFDGIYGKRYDLIIANLPIVDYRPEEESGITTALYDPNFYLHHRILAEAKEYLNPGGALTFTHANLQSAKTDMPDKDFEVLEELIAKYGYEIVEKSESDALGYKWVNYKIMPRQL